MVDAPVQPAPQRRAHREQQQHRGHREHPDPDQQVAADQRRGAGRGQRSATDHEQHELAGQHLGRDQRQARDEPDHCSRHGAILPENVGPESAYRDHAVTKSMSSSTAPISGVSRSRKLRTAPSTRRAPSAGSPQRSAAQTPVFQSVPAGHLRPAADADHRRLHRLPHVDVGMAGDQHVRAGHRRRGPRLLGPGHQVVDQHARAGAAGPGSNSATAAARSSMPCIGSTTTPSTRRSCPHTRSTSSASCRPSTQIRAARAVRAVCPTHLRPTRTPSGPAPPARAHRADQGGRRALDQEPGRHQREDPAPPVPVLQGHLAAVRGDHRAAEPAGRVLHHQAELGRQLRDRPAHLVAAAVGAEDPPVVLAGHSPSLYRRRAGVARLRHADRGRTAGRTCGYANVAVFTHTAGVP